MRLRRPSLKAVVWTGLVAIAIASLVVSVALGPFYLRVEHAAAEPRAGYYADFYWYVSPAAQQMARDGKPVTFLIQPNNSGTNSDDAGVHRQDAWWTCYGRHGIADDLGVVLLVPAFLRPGTDWTIYTHALDRDVLTTGRTDLARLDLQLLAMVDHARKVLALRGIPSDDKVLIQGYSASGMFANRFAALHPDRVKAVASGSPGGWPIAPVASWNGADLPYPAGVSDLAQLAGHAFEAQAYAKVPQLIVMGNLDDNDSVDFRDGWDEGPAKLVDRLFGETPLSRWERAQAVYRAAGANAQFLLVDGVGHDRRALQHHTTSFFRTVLEREHRQ